MVDEHRCRFDFTHFSAMTPDEIARTERLVNQLIFGAYDVTVTEMPIAEAKKLGAMALFGEKYGEVVRSLQRFRQISGIVRRHPYFQHRPHRAV